MELDQVNFNMKRTKPVKKHRISVQAAKAKGRNLQQYVCKMVSEITGFEWGSSGDDKPIESRPMGQKGMDIRMESQVRELFPFSVECKFQESWAVHGWIEQAKGNQMKGTDWLLVCKRSRKKPVVIMDADSFFSLYKAYIG